MAEQQNNNINANSAVNGLNLDSTLTTLKEGQLTFALNAQLESFDGQYVTYQNEQANIGCITFPVGYKVIGVKNLTEIDRVVYFLTDPSTGASQIGYSDHEACIYNILIDDNHSPVTVNDIILYPDRLNFSISHPIHKVVSKITNCSSQIYWTDGFNPRRYLDFDNLPWKELINDKNAFKPLQAVGVLDANKLLVQPNFAVPIITPTVVNTGGTLTTGVYQFAIQYSNALGEGYTSFYSVTNPVGIFESKFGNDFNLPTGKAITVHIENLDTSRLYDYYNLAVIKTVNNTSTPELIGTFSIIDDKADYTYTGVNNSNIRLDIIEIFNKFPYYDIADTLYEVDQVLGWANLKGDDEINYQPIWSQVKLQWESWQLPYNQFEAYNNGINTALYRGYMRDEVYAFEGYFILANGKQTRSFHIPGRLPNGYDLEFIINDDGNQVNANHCAPDQYKRRWQVYNTAIKTDFTEEWIRSTNKDCYIGKYEYGEMGYWASEEVYPNNPDIWGDLANKPIRHHKFPDCVVTNIHDNAGDKRSFEHKIYPLALRVDVGSINSAIQVSNLTDEQKRQIVGFGIARANRAGGNNSIVAKGLLTNVGKYTFEDKEYYYPNYPYNDLRPDPFFAKEKVQNHSGYRPDLSLVGFGEHSKTRYVFHSPDTHFTQPTGVDSGFLKLETIEYGKSYGHFVKVNRNAEYKFLTKDAYYGAAAIGLSSGMIIGAGTFGWPNFSLTNTIPSYTATLEIFEKLAPFTNFGYSFNSIGEFSNSIPVQNEQGYKVRAIVTGQYLIDGIQSVEDGHAFNNYRRESSVYLHTTVALPFPTEYGAPEDKSRYNLSSADNQDFFGDFYKEFVNTNSQIITDAFIKDNIYTVSSSAAAHTYVYVFRSQQSGPQSNIGLIPDSIKNMPVGSIWNDVNGNQFIILSSLELPGTDPNNSGYFLYKYESYAQRIVKGSAEPSGALTLDPASPIHGVTPHFYMSVEKITILDYYGKTRRNEYAQRIRAILEQFVIHPELLNTPVSVVDQNSFLLQQAQATYFSAYTKSLEGKQFGSATVERITDISAYYGAIKRDVINQYGQIYSYETISTGFYQLLYGESGDLLRRYSSVFGGDTFINKLSLKTKIPFFLNNTIDQPNGTDIAYDEIANFGFPMFWTSTRPIDLEVDIAEQASDAIDTILHPTFLDVIGDIFSGGIATIMPAINLIITIFTSIFKTLGVKNTNLDAFSTKDIIEQGISYLFAYGIPTFFAESVTNVDFRQATNAQEGNFYPNVGKDIPDTWVQEVEVPIIHDNTYNYNQSYSKQNKENFFAHLKEDYDPTKRCLTFFPNRTIWSDKSSREETKNNWLIYRPANFYDLEKSFGALIAIDKIEHNQLLVRFENKSQIYNALTTVQVTNGPAAYTGTGAMFSTPALDLSQTDTGYAGSQHKLLLRTEFGHFFIDAKRGQILLLQGNQTKDIADKGMDKWFSEHLPFTISKYFPSVNVDNHFNQIGLHAVYDSFYQRIIITKLDYEPVVDGITYDGVFKVNNIEIALNDTRYFRSKSWTLSYSFKMDAWVSFHSYQPSFYIPFPNYFQSGVNSNGTLWNHNQDISKFQTYYGVQYPYVLEYPFVYKFQDEVLQYVQNWSTAYRYNSIRTPYEPDEALYFNKAYIYNDQQHSGILVLTPKPKGNLAAYFGYPKYNATNKEILFTKIDHFHRYNTFWDIRIDKSIPMFTESNDYRFTDKDVVESNLDYSQKNFAKATIRGKYVKIREILDDKNDFKLLSRVIVSPTSTSYK